MFSELTLFYVGQIMDASIAILFAVVGLADAKINFCDEPGGCFAKNVARPEISFSAGDGIFQQRRVNKEYYVRYEFDHTLGPFQPSLGFSITNQNDMWLGFGNTTTKNFADDKLYLRLSNLAGLYRRGDGVDLGSYLEFRSSIELGYQAKSGVKVGVSYDHRSNAEISSLNPGFETLQLRLSIPLK